MTESKLAGDAARLVSYALRPKLARGSNEDYGNLWREYRGDERFRAVTDAIIEGLGLVTLALTNQGLVVAPSSDSPFSFRISDYGSGVSSVRDRTVVGLIHLGIAASCYPRDVDLDEETVVRRSVMQVEELLRSACKSIDDRRTDDPQAEVDSGTTEAWRAFSAMPPLRTGRNGQRLSDCTTAIIASAFDWLVDQGFARATSTKDHYQVLDRYRVQVRELAGHETFATLRAITDAAVSDNEVVTP